ncbi:MAG: diaminopimelate epimerase [Alphaproteobacteria bacterium]|nr:MAG: diaminopimelate epimerase [Alphaproteobacteria bacterium]
MKKNHRGIPFIKMHGLGNDFIFVFQSSFLPQAPDRETIIRMSDRMRGIGADQLIWVEDFSSVTVAKMHIFNRDGTIAKACGNATRCLAYLYAQKFQQTNVMIHTPGGGVSCRVHSVEAVSVTIPAPIVGFSAVQGVGSYDYTQSPVSLPSLYSLVFVQTGNFHMIHVVDSLPDDETLIAYGRWLNSSHPNFPSGINVEFVKFFDATHGRMRVYERGAECITQACGTGACASVFVGAQQGYCDTEVILSLDGGELRISVKENNQLEMIGAVCYVFDGIYLDGGEYHARSS